MGLADKLKDMTKKAEEAAATHKDEVRRAIVKAEEAADKQTGGQYHDQIAKARQKADAFVENLEEPPSEPKPRPPE
jgi:F0F1-type ATP synthase membrane subunit b/b'